jgi:uncharacterized protein YlxW (UPF0749 family)
MLCRVIKWQFSSFNDFVPLLFQIEHENEVLKQQLNQQETDHQGTIRMLQDQIQAKERKLAAEVAEIERSYKETEHMLKEQLEEKSSIIQVRIHV